MFRRLRGFVAALAFAALGAVLGRIVGRMRRQSEAGQPQQFELSSVTIRFRDLVPGLIAGMRVRERPWSYLHLPSWLAAFVVNFAFAALGRELGPLVSALTGVGHDDGRDEDARPMPSGASTVWTADSTSSPQEPGGAPPAGFRPFSE